MFNRSLRPNANSVHFKTFRCNNQNQLDQHMSNFCHNLGDNVVIMNESTSVCYINLKDLPQDIDSAKKQSCAPATRNYFSVNKAEQPIQFIGTIMYETVD